MDFRRLLIAVCCVLACAASAQASTQCDFENGLGQSGHAVGMSVPGFSFSTTLGHQVLFADANSGYYSVRSDNGEVFGTGEYFISDDVAAYIADPADRAKVSFAWSPASYFTVGYSSQLAFILEAYDSLGTLLDSETGAANTYSKGGTGLAYLTVSHPGIAYVVMHDQGGYWMIDNISTDAVPEPSSVLMLLGGLSGLAVTLRRRRM